MLSPSKLLRPFVRHSCATGLAHMLALCCWGDALLQVRRRCWSFVRRRWRSRVAWKLVLELRRLWQSEADRTVVPKTARHRTRTIVPKLRKSRTILPELHGRYCYCHRPRKKSNGNALAPSARSGCTMVPFCSRRTDCHRVRRCNVGRTPLCQGGRSVDGRGWR